jgi:hypothetical protein
VEGIRVRFPAGTSSLASRSICYINCYVSWSKDVSGLRAQLYSGALDIFNTCNSDGWVSGSKRNVEIGGKKLTQCLSNRPDNCS